jgi:hypothetical protein
MDTSLYRRIVTGLAGMIAYAANIGGIISPSH